MADPAVAAKGGLSGTVAYPTTKAATVMVAAKYAAGLKDDGFTVISLRPGVVNTTATAADPDAANAVFKRVVDMHVSRGQKPDVLTPAQSVEAQLRVIDAGGPEQNGAFLSYDGDLTK
ncbi:hypothetical protein BD413DRAFT_610213 [Trametes elegans]|nr:hypothetical protein BD413DRAFT_610213 [Trametes elegans]